MSWLSEALKKFNGSLSIWEQAVLIAARQGADVARPWLMDQVKRIMPSKALLEKLAAAGISAPLPQLLDERDELQQEAEEMVDAMLNPNFVDTDIEDQLAQHGITAEEFDAKIEEWLAA